MLKLKRSVFALLFIGLSSASMLSSAAGPSNTTRDYGNLVHSVDAVRTIELSASTKWVNVEDGETVQFKFGDHTFTWHFSTYNKGTAFDLSKIAPADANIGHVTVYVAPDPLYRG